MATTSASPISIPQINNEYYVGEPMLRTIQQAVTYAIADSNAGNVIISQAYTGTDLIDTVTGGSSTVFIADERNGQRQVYYWNGANYVAAAFVQDGTIMAPAANFDTITAQGADFDTCLVANSPVRTFANTGDPSTGMEFPPAGIGVSTGTAWSATSIDPATIPRLNTPNTYTAAPQTVNEAGANITMRGNVPMGSINVANPGTTISWNLHGDAETSFTTVGSLVGSGGFSWWNTWVSGPALATPLMVLDSNAHLTVNGNITCITNNGPGTIPLVAPTEGMALGWNATNSWGETDFVNSHAGGGGAFAWYNLPSGTTVTPSTAASMILDSAGNLLLNQGSLIVTSASGQITSATYLSGGTATSIPPSGAREYGFYLYNISTLPLITKLDCCGDGGNRGQLLVVGTAPGGGSGSHNYAVFGTESGTSTPGSTIFDNLSVTTQTPGNAVGLTIGEDPSVSTNWGGASMSFTPNVGTGNLGQCSINASKSGIGFSDILIGTAGSNVTLGAASTTVHVNGTFTATTKNFKIPHPLAPQEKYLIHSCLEGPEIAVYYRGETVTANGQAEVILPDYFEALTTPTDRSVLLTQIFEDDSEAIIGSNTFSMLMASRVKDGKFKIRSSEPVAKVWWEVKAVRRDVEPLVKETRRDAEAIRPRDAVTAGTGRTRKPR